MDAQLTAELQVLLEGVPLPASRDELLRYARAQDERALTLLERLPSGSYDRLDAVGEALSAPVAGPKPALRLPKPESGKPPGGADYLRPRPEPGAVRPSAPRTNPPQQAIAKKSSLKGKQKAKQQADDARAEPQQEQG